MSILFALLAAFTAAVAITLTKAGLKNVDPVLAFALQAIMILAVSWAAVLLQKKTGEISAIDSRAWLFLIGAGVVTCFSSLFQFAALKGGNASVVSSIERLSLVFTIVFAIVFLKEEWNWKLLAGSALMIGGAVLIGFSRAD